ncbi:hypothetical protein ZOSMA_95G00710 [Zostera marina]|uniref:Uncharacterized protein n=1 Tax=Zostera marina TaxID=29655 RepID=A0A0K9NKH3_ZOSMR|nr:hypothetical protein ZOSMA_95G00710 [Zostera marina]
MGFAMAASASPEAGYLCIWTRYEANRDILRKLILEIDNV